MRNKNQTKGRNMKANALTQIFLMTAALSISGCYTQFSAPIARQNYSEQSDSDTLYQEEQSYENYTFDSSSLNDYSLGYRDGYWDSMNRNLWYGYNPYSPFYHSYRYHSPYLGYYDPWFYDPFYGWNYYGYNSWYGGYYPYYGYYYGYYGGYYGHHHGGFWYGNGYHYSGPTVAAGREQLKAQYLPNSTVSGSRRAAGNSEQSGASYLPIATSGTAAASTTSKTSTTVINGSTRDKSSWIRQTLTTTSSNTEPIVGFQTTLTPTAKTQTTIVNTASGSRSSSRSSSSQRSNASKTKTVSKPSSSSGSTSSSSSASSSAYQPSSSSSSSSSGSSSTSSSSSESHSSSSSNSNSSRSSHKASSSSVKNKK
jgi:hypothetical protein